MVYQSLVVVFLLVLLLVFHNVEILEKKTPRCIKTVLHIMYSFVFGTWGDSGVLSKPNKMSRVTFDKLVFEKDVPSVAGL